VKKLTQKLLNSYNPDFPLEKDKLRQIVSRWIIFACYLFVFGYILGGKHYTFADLQGRCNVWSGKKAS
jgi:hypothetical protein